MLGTCQPTQKRLLEEQLQALPIADAGSLGLVFQMYPYRAGLSRFIRLLFSAACGIAAKNEVNTHFCPL